MSIDSSPRRQAGDSWLTLPAARRVARSYTISTSRVETSPDQHHARRVLVPGGYGSARGAGVGAFRKGKCVLGSRSALCAVHGGVRGVDQVDDAPVFAGHLHQGLFRGPDARVRCPSGHGRLRQEAGAEVLHGQNVMVTDDGLGPSAGRVLPLPHHLGVQLRRLPLRLAVALGSGLSSRRPAPGHHPLVPRQAYRACVVVSVVMTTNLSGGTDS